MTEKYRSQQAENWYRSQLEHPEKFPFHFTYRQTEYHGFPSGKLRLISRKTTAEEGKECTELSWALDDGLLLTLAFSFYPAFGVSEWTVWFENTGSRDSGILEDIKSVLTFCGERPVLKGILGDHVNQYRPYVQELEDMDIRFVSDSGRATHVNFPYFNLEYGDGGVMLAIGWAGTWAADFSAAEGYTRCTLRSTNGLRTFLRPGERIRTALFVRAPYAVRNENYATNFWRSWFLCCNLPAADAAGSTLQPFSTCCIASDTGLPNSDGSISERHTTWRPSLEKMLAENARVDFRWFDAGWYAAPDGSSPVSDWWGTVGTWELDPVKWPGKTFLESTDFARKHGMKTLMWFEPERITDPDSLVKYHGYRPDWAIRKEGWTAISNNIGDPDCLAWTTERICRVLRDNRVEMYREDNNSDPGALWQYLDSLEGENRSGITESKFIIAHYQMWDDIIRCTSSIGGCAFVDSCASGGGRNDLESLRRAVPLLRSDSDRTSTSLRLSMTTSFNKWIPFCGANSKEKAAELDAAGRSDVYTWRASYLPVLNVDSQFVHDPGQDFSMLRFGLEEWKKVSPYLLGDFYLLTPWHSQTDKTAFTAYSFFHEEEGKGLMLLFRMEECAEESLSVRLPYAKNGSRYLLTDEDSGEAISLPGEELRQTGCRFTFAEPRTARLVWIGEER